MENKYISKQEYNSIVNSRNGCGIDDSSTVFYEAEDRHYQFCLKKHPNKIFRRIPNKNRK